MPFWLFLHLGGMGLWLGGGVAVLVTGLAAAREDRAVLGTVLRLQWQIARFAIFPGAALTTASGLMLTFRNIHTPTMGSPWMVSMQGAGLLAALLALSITVPSSARLARLDPNGPHANYVDRLRRRQRMVGLVILAFGLIALIGGAKYRYGA
jgi:hypothetical protein